MVDGNERVPAPDPAHSLEQTSRVRRMNSQQANLLQIFVGEIPFFFHPGFLYVPDPGLLGDPADIFQGQTQQISRSRLGDVLWNFITVLHEPSLHRGPRALTRR